MQSKVPIIENLVQKLNEIEDKHDGSFHFSILEHIENLGAAQLEYGFAQMTRDFQNFADTYDIIIGVTCERIERNYFTLFSTRPKFGVASLYGAEYFAKVAKTSIERFTFYLLSQIILGVVSNSPTDSFHNDIGCLFDKNYQKTNIVLGLRKCLLCRNCEKRIRASVTRPIMDSVRVILNWIRTPWYREYFDLIILVLLAISGLSLVLWGVVYLTNTAQSIASAIGTFVIAVSGLDIYRFMKR